MGDMEHTSSIERRGEAIWLTLARGERNLLDLGLTRWLRDSLREADVAAPQAVVLTGQGEAFCGGADGPYLRSTGTAEPFADACVELFELLHTMSTPVVAAVNGDALAGGYALAALADVVIAADGARFGTIEASLGGWAWIAQTPVLARVPAKAALTNLLTGIPFDTERAEKLGLVDEVVPATELDEAVDRYVALLAPGAAAARQGRPMMRTLLDPAFGANLRAGAQSFVKMFG